MTTKQIVLPFGLDGWKAFKVEFKANGTKLDSYLLNQLVENMQDLGWSEDKIGRIIFEEAIDRLMGIVALGIVEKIKNRKVPKSLTIPISRGSSFYNE